MYRIDVKNEVRKITSSKPVHAAAGAGVLATQTLRDLSGRIVRWGTDGTVTSLPARANEYVMTARAKAADGYDKLADRGKRVLDGQSNGSTKSALNGKSTGSRASSSRATGSGASSSTASSSRASSSKSK